MPRGGVIDRHTCRSELSICARFTGSTRLDLVRSCSAKSAVNIGSFWFTGAGRAGWRRAVSRACGMPGRVGARATGRPWTHLLAWGFRVLQTRLSAKTVGDRAVAQ